MKNIYLKTIDDIVIPYAIFEYVEKSSTSYN